MKDFLEHTYNVITTSMDRFFYIKQNKLGGLKKKSQEDELDDKEFDAKSVRSLNMLQKYASKNTLRELLKNKKNTASLQGTHTHIFFQLTSHLNKFH